MAGLAHDIALAVQMLISKYKAGEPELALYFTEPNGEHKDEIEVLVHNADLVQAIGETLLLVMHPGREHDPEYETQVFRADYFTRMIVCVDEDDIAAVKAAEQATVKQ